MDGWIDREKVIGIEEIVQQIRHVPCINLYQTLVQHTVPKALPSVIPEHRVWNELGLTQKPSNYNKIDKYVKVEENGSERGIKIGIYWPKCVSLVMQKVYSIMNNVIFLKFVNRLNVDICIL